MTDGIPLLQKLAEGGILAAVLAVVLTPFIWAFKRFVNHVLAERSDIAASLRESAAAFATCTEAIRESSRNIIVATENGRHHAVEIVREAVRAESDRVIREVRKHRNGDETPRPRKV